MSKIPTDDVLQSLYKLRKREFDQLKTGLSEVAHHGEEKHSSKDQVTKLSSQKREERD